jgi:hypothetical protein
METHLQIAHAADRDGRKGDVEVVWGGRDGLDPPGEWEVLGDGEKYKNRES